MRNEAKIIKQVLTYAENKEDVRLVLMNGSRVNDKVQKDQFSDYDFMFLVHEPKKYLENKKWMSCFGDIMISQVYDFSKNDIERYIFLTLYQDEVRIDIQIFAIKDYEYCINKSSLTTILLDKDQRCEIMSPPSDISHRVKKPSESEFIDIIEGFWWFTTNVAKGIYRKELNYVKFIYDFILIQEYLVKMLSWYAGLRHDWKINVGKNGKWLEKYLPNDVWNQFEKVFVSHEYNEIWKAMFNTIDLMNEISSFIARELNYNFPSEMIYNVNYYLTKIRNI